MTLQEIDRASIAARRLVEQALRGGRNPDGTPEATAAVDVLTLAAINAAIWERENLMRRLVKLRGSDSEANIELLAEIGTLAIEVQTLNDWRAKALGQEKIRL